MPEPQEQKLRLPPQSIEAEQAVLGSMLINSNAVPKALRFVKSESFYKSAHVKIFDSMMKLFNDNKSIDTVTLIEQLEKDDNLESVGGAYYITGLSSEAPSSENVEFYAKIVQEKYILRTMISAAVELSTLAYEAKEDVTTILDKAEQTIFALAEDSMRGEFIQVDSMLEKVLEKFIERKSGDVIGIPSGVTDLDNILSGFQKSDLIILAGRPSMGKTALALSIARNMTVDFGHSVGFFSLEMSRMQLAERLITAEAQVDSHLVRTGRLPKGELKKLANAANPLALAKFYIDDSAGLTILEIRAKARRLKAEKDIDLLIVDYLQLISGLGKNENRQQEITLISRSLKAIAKELDIPVIAISQLSRAPETRTDHRPVMSDLRESGAIEQDADVVLFVYRKFVYSRKDEDKGLAEIIISKHRNGPTGAVPVAFIEQYARFGNIDMFGEMYADQGLPA